MKWSVFGNVRAQCGPGHNQGSRGTHVRRRFLRGAAAVAVVGAFVATPVLALAPGPTILAADIFLAPTINGAARANLTSFDISWVDSAHHLYFLADRSNKSVDIVDTESNNYVGSVTTGNGGAFAGFTGNNDTSGPNGVVSTKGGNELWVGDGGSKVRVVDVKTRTITDTINTGGNGRADEDAFGAGMILIANDAESGTGNAPCPFLSFISAGTHQVVGQVIYDGNPTPAIGCPAHTPSPAVANIQQKQVHLPYAATDGLEQPLWDPQLHAFFQAVPLASDTFGSKGEIDQLDPRTMTVVKRFSVSSSGGQCHPQGLVLGLNGNLWAGCNPDPSAGSPAVLEINPNLSGPVVGGFQEVSNGVVATVPLGTTAPAGKTAGPDEIWFNQGDHRLYAANSNAHKLSVVDTDSTTLLENVDTSVGSHSVAADWRLNRIYVPLTTNAPSTCPATGCISEFLSGGAMHNEAHDMGDQ